MNKPGRPCDSLGISLDWPLRNGAGIPRTQEAVGKSPKLNDE